MATIENKLIAIGASTGGAEAIEALLKNLPSVLPPILIAQHMPARFTTSFTKRLNLSATLSVKEAANNDLLIPGQVYLAPGGLNMTLAAKGNGFCVSCASGSADNPICPSVDVLFESVARYAQERKMLGILLTGMGKDGAIGLKSMREAGCATIGQDEQSAVVYGMPKAAMDIGAVQRELPLEKIPSAIIDFATKE